MFSNIPPSHYHSDSVFQLEKTKIFQNNWIFVCFKSDVSNVNDFVTKTIGGIPVVVQNLNGDIKAFMNVCSHRFSILQTQPKGNRGLFCPYHGWAYDKRGIPSGIPKKPLFEEFSKNDLCKLKLKEYSLESCGDMYFVHITEPKQSLREFLGNFYEVVENMTIGANVLVDENPIDIGCNWKVVVENTLESYHVALVHQDTFQKLGAGGLNFTFTGNHSSWEASLALRGDDPKLRKIHSNFDNRSFKIDGYNHFLIYPNLLISTSYGVSFNYSVIEPISADKTSFTSYVYLSQPNKRNSTYEMYKQSLIDFNRKVFDEDKVICEEVQKGVAVTEQPGVLSLEEHRVHAFQQNYIKQLT
jgi:phenylpropionate dioxygenase-like ring-hydroxylating dioxygenase large terminal subunit